MAGPIWCNYCRCYVVNGQCPKCGRIYVFNNGATTSKKEERPTTTTKYKRSSSTSSSTSNDDSLHAVYSNVDGSFAAGFWLAMAINFIAIIIASKRDKPLTKKGAIVGTIISSVIMLHVIAIVIATLNNNWINFCS